MSQTEYKATPGPGTGRSAVDPIFVAFGASTVLFGALSTLTLYTHERPLASALAAGTALAAAAGFAAVRTLRNQADADARERNGLQSRIDDAARNIERLTEEAEDTNQLMQQVSVHFDELFRKIPAPCFCFDADGRFKEWNKAFETLTNIDPGKLINEPVSSYVSLNAQSSNMRSLIASIFAGESFEGIELEALCCGGSSKTLLCNTFPLRGENGMVTAAICAGVDITERIKLEERMLQHVEMLSAAQLMLEEQHRELAGANEKLQMLAMSDSLTGLFNHRALQERLTVEFKRSNRYNSSVSLLLIDVDRFKKYNDSYGHLAGDEVLKSVASLLSNSMRDTDFVARYGGEEFIVVLPHTDYLGALEAAERFRIAIEQAPWELIRVTVSIGVATFKTNMAHYTDLIALADQALYHCKQHGRNQVCHAQDVPAAGLKSAPVSADLDIQSSLAL